jgi:hypothetical protein
MVRNTGAECAVTGMVRNTGAECAVTVMVRNTGAECAVTLLVKKIRTPTVSRKQLQTNGFSLLSAASLIYFSVFQFHLELHQLFAFSFYSPDFAVRSVLVKVNNKL